MKIAGIPLPHRERLWPLLAAAALLGGVLWVQALLREETPADRTRPRGEPDFTAEGVRISAFDEQGKPRYELEAARLTNYPDDYVARLVSPVLHLHEDGNGGETTVTAREGESHRPPDAEPFVILTGDVRVDRRLPQQAPMALTGEALTVWPDSERVMSNAPVTLTQGGQRAQGDMLVASNIFGTLRLDGRVSLTLPPATRSPKTP